VFGFAVALQGSDGAGDYGRYLYAVGVGDTWRDALDKAYQVCNGIEYPNKIFKRNLFCYDHDRGDYDLASNMPVIHEIVNMWG
jgi:phosphoribosylamine-glycine ligase